MVKSNSTENGNVGEHYVLAKLSELGYIASLVDRNTKVIDILACNKELSKYVSIQVKTRLDCCEFTLSKKHENFRQKSLFYIFVNLNKSTTQMPDYYIISASKVADNIHKYHQIWINTPGKNGRVHKDQDMRIYDTKRWGDKKDNFSVLGLN